MKSGNIRVSQSKEVEWKDKSYGYQCHVDRPGEEL